MADKSSVYSTLSIELLLKRKNHQRLVDVIPQQTYAPLSPCPELRCNIIDNGNAALLHLPRHPPVKCRRVDHDGEVGPASVSFLDQMPVEAENLGQVAENFGDADHGEILSVDDCVAAGGAHPLSANAEELNLLIAAAQGCNELRAVHFSGSFAG